MSNFFPNNKYQLVLDNNYVGIFASFVLYVAFSILINEIIWPILFYYIVYILKLYYIFSPSFLSSFFGVNHLILIPGFCAIIFQAKSFNPIRLCLLTGNDLLDSLCKPELTKKRLYCVLIGLYCALFLFIMIPYLFRGSNAIISLYHGSGLPLYKYLNFLSFFDCLSKWSMLIPFDVTHFFILLKFNTLIYFVSFIFGFNLLIFPDVIIGIQRFIWKRER